MRKLNVEDSFAFSEILDKMGVQDDLNSMMDKAKLMGADGQAWMGGQIVLLIIKRIYKAKEEVIELLASLFEKEPVELRKLPIKELANMIKELVANEDFGSFFQ